MPPRNNSIVERWLPDHPSLPELTEESLVPTFGNFIDVAFENGDTGRDPSGAHLPVWLNLSAASFHHEYKYCHRGPRNDKRFVVPLLSRHEWQGETLSFEIDN